MIIDVLWSGTSGLIWGSLKTMIKNIRKPGGIFSPEIRGAIKTNSLKGK